jgi:hypothetical protein
LALNQSIAHAYDVLKANYSLVQQEPYKKAVATSYNYSYYANIHARMGMVVAQ